MRQIPRLVRQAVPSEERRTGGTFSSSHSPSVFLFMVLHLRPSSLFCQTKKEEMFCLVLRFARAPAMLSRISDGKCCILDIPNMADIGMLIRFECGGDKKFAASVAILCMTCKTFNEALTQIRRHLSKHRQQTDDNNFRMPFAYAHRFYKESRGTVVIPKYRHDLLEWLFDLTFRARFLRLDNQYHVLDCYSACISLFDLFAEDNLDYIDIDNLQAVGMACLFIVLDCSLHKTSNLTLKMCSRLCSHLGHCIYTEDKLHSVKSKILKSMSDRKIRMSTLVKETFAYNVRRSLHELKSSETSRDRDIHRKLLCDFALHLSSIVTIEDTFLQYSMRCIAWSAVSYAMMSLGFLKPNQTWYKHLVDIDGVFIRDCMNRIHFVHKTTTYNGRFKRMVTVFRSVAFFSGVANIKPIECKENSKKREREF
jgi:hypothetical protein